MTIFEAVKSTVTPKMAAEHFGLSVSRNGMVCCPFHDDRHPSMKLNEDYFYSMWCEDNAYKPLAARTVSMTLKKHADEFGLEHDNHITNRLGKRVNGFWGIEALVTPPIL